LIGLRLEVTEMTDKKKESKQQGRKKVREKFAEITNLPKEIILNIPKITIVGNRDMIIENYKGIVEYESGRIKLNTGAGIIEITGKELVISEITSEDAIISGSINSLEFI
jgi:sporulation protein YqfC